MMEQEGLKIPFLGSFQSVESKHEEPRNGHGLLTYTIHHSRSVGLLTVVYVEWYCGQADEAQRE